MSPLEGTFITLLISNPFKSNRFFPTRSMISTYNTYWYVNIQCSATELRFRLIFKPEHFAFPRWGHQAAHVPQPLPSVPSCLPSLCGSLSGQEERQQRVFLLAWFVSNLLHSWELQNYSSVVLYMTCGNSLPVTFFFLFFKKVGFLTLQCKTSGVGLHLSGIRIALKRYLLRFLHLLFQMEN